MPGLAGIVTRLPSHVAKQQLALMLGVMVHESFYTVRSLIDETLGLYLGWTALAGSPSDRGPIESADHEKALVLAGEQFDMEPDDLRRMLADDSFVADLNGFFQGVLVERSTGRIGIFNDRYGMHRLYVHRCGEGLYFAAEAKAILAVRPELRGLEAAAVGEVLTLGCVLENRTLFPGISLMPGGSLWLICNHELSQTTYFRRQEWESQPPFRTVDQFYDALRDVFADIIPKYLSANQTIGMSLTGGLDTRMVMAWQRRPPGSLPCYTFNGPFRECEDVTIARRVARSCGQEFNIITLDDRLLSRFDYYLERAILLTDGCAETRLAADVLINIEARRIAPIRLTGLYGGEVLRRVRAFKPVTLLDDLFAPAAREIAGARDAYHRVVDTHALSFAVFNQAPWHYFGTLCLEQTQVTMRTPFMDNRFVSTVYRAPVAATTSNDISLRLIADGSPQLATIPTDRGLRRRWSLRGTIDHAWKEFLFRAEYAYDYGMPQWLAPIDRALSGVRPERAILGRHKAMHFRIWYRDQLSSYLRATLLDPTSLSRPYLQRSAVARVVEDHLSGRRNYTMEIHRLLRLEMTSRLVDSSASYLRHVSPVEVN